MIYIKIDWTLIAICVGGAVSLYIIKFLIAHFRRSRENTNGNDTSEKLDLPTQEPPPEFYTALQYPKPICYVDVEEPPPSYIDYLQLIMQSQSQLEKSETIVFPKDTSNSNDLTVTSTI